MPALADSSLLRYFTFTIMYFAQGVPSGVLYFAFPAWMAMNGITPIQIGSYMAVAMIPWSFKIVVAPLMDRFTFLPMGRRKPWVLLGQTGLIIGFIVLSMVQNPLEHMSLLMVLGFIISFFTIIQDIAIDSMAIDLLPDDQQARANGLMWGSSIFGRALTVALCSYLMSELGYKTALLLFSVIVLLIMIVPIVLRERKGEKRLPWLAGETSPDAAEIQSHSWKTLLKNVIKVFILPASLFLAAANFFSAAGEFLMNSTLSVFTVQELGWADTKYSNIYSSASMISGALAMLVGGALIDFFGKKRMILIYMSVLIVLVTSFVLLKPHWDQTWLVKAFFITFYTFNTFMVVTVFAIAMNLSWRRVAATQFTIYMTLGNLGHSVGSWLMGALKTVVTWEFVLLAYIPLLILAMTLAWFINFDKHKIKVQELEQKFHHE